VGSSPTESTKFNGYVAQSIRARDSYPRGRWFDSTHSYQIIGEKMKHKMYCIFAKEAIDKMNGIRGKMCAQAGHAFLHTALLAQEQFPQQFADYINGDHRFKITLIVDTVEELKQLQQAYQDKCATKLITDKGFTVFTEPTTTCLGIGPLREDMIGADLKTLKLFN
jgi:peptidyl-tRNA hydrolase